MNNNMNSHVNQTVVPTQIIDGLKIAFDGKYLEEISFPIATYETALFYSIKRGVKVAKEINGISSVVIKNCMTRSVILETNSAITANDISNDLKNYLAEMKQEVQKTSKFTTLEDFTTRIIGNILFIRFSFNVSEASGHNMSTKASDILIDYILKKYENVNYLSISGNYCTDKKNSSVNAILGRGFSVISEATITKEICQKLLRTTPEAIVNLNVKKNLIGSIISGGVQTGNAHFANMLAGFYLATGQDIANIVEGSQGITHAEIKNSGDLYFSVSCPNIIVGTVGNGKDIDFVKKNLEEMNCTGENSANRLAQIACAIVLCGELSLLAAITNKNELTNSHLIIERK